MSSLKWVEGRAFAPYEQWECFKAGFHNVPFDDQHAELSRVLYCDMPRLRVQCDRVLAEWPITSAVHISQQRNHRAWMGHAACFLSHGAGSQSSVAAYWMLDDAGRDAANNCVMEAVEKWKSQHQHLLSSDPCRPLSGPQGFLFSMRPDYE